MRSWHTTLLRALLLYCIADAVTTYVWCVPDGRTHTKPLSLAMLARSLHAALPAGSNEGIIHVSKPFFSVQFHPEAAGGPFDTAFLFEAFVRHVRGAAPQLTLLDPAIYRNDRASLKRVLLVGSGGLSIGQAGEFDYSGLKRRPVAF